MRAAIGELAGLLGSKITARETAYKAGMNNMGALPGQYRAINDEAQHSFNRINAWASGGQSAPASAQPVQQAQHQAPAPLPAPDAQGWITLPNGIRIREKK